MRKDQTMAYHNYFFISGFLNEINIPKYKPKRGGERQRENVNGPKTSKKNKSVKKKKSDKENPWT